MYKTGKETNNLKKFATNLELNSTISFNKYHEGFPCGAVVESLPANAGDTGSSPGLGGSHMPRSD